MKKSKAKQRIRMQVNLPSVLAAQVRQIAYWAETEPETVISVFLAAALLRPRRSAEE